jgi:hypothetical protein
VAGGIPCATYLLTCWSAECLPSRFVAVSGGMGALLFCQCNGVEKLCMGWGIRVSKFWFFLVLFFCQVWLQHLSKSFDLQSSCCQLMHSCCHLRSSLILNRLWPLLFFPLSPIFFIHRDNCAIIFWRFCVSNCGHKSQCLNFSHYCSLLSHFAFPSSIVSWW